MVIALILPAASLNKTNVYQSISPLRFIIFNSFRLEIEKPVVFKPFFYYWVRFIILNLEFYSSSTIEQLTDNISKIWVHRFEQLAEDR